MIMIIRYKHTKKDEDHFNFQVHKMPVYDKYRSSSSALNILRMLVSLDSIAQEKKKVDRLNITIDTEG